MYTFEQIDLNKIDLDEFYNFKNKSIFTRLEWINFIAEDSKAIPIILRITNENSFIGYFSALMFKKLGIRIIASPFRGWSTCFMGFDTVTEHKADMLNDLSAYLFKKFQCLYMEIIDRDISVEQAQSMGFIGTPVSTLELDVDKPEEEIFKAFDASCRRNIRQFKKKNAVLEHAEPDDRFAEEYYAQLKDVFAKQGTLPTYSVDKVKRLLRHLAETDMLLCLRIKNQEGMSIATLIAFGYNSKFFIWGSASLRAYQIYRPNEYMVWYLIRYWRSKGFRILDMVGVREYKWKFGPLEKQYARITISKYKILIMLRNMAQISYYKLLKIMGLVLRKK